MGMGSRDRGHKDTYTNDVDKGGLARVLQADERELHLLLPEEALYPFYTHTQKGK
jgi:hypothetical protein